MTTSNYDKWYKALYKPKPDPYAEQKYEGLSTCFKNVIKCNRAGKLSYCKPRGGK